MKRFQFSIKPVLIASLSLSLGGCAQGPDFQIPAASTVSGYTETSLPTATSSSLDQPVRRSNFWSDRISPNSDGVSSSVNPSTG